MANQNLDLALRIRADLKAAARQLDDFEKELDGVSEAAAEADANLDKATAPRRGGAEKDLDRVTRELEEVDAAATSADASLDKATAPRKDGGTAQQLDQLEKELEQVDEAATKTGRGLAAINRNADGAADAMNATSASATRTGRSLRTVDTNARRASDGIETVEDDARRAGRGLDGMSRSANGLSSRLKGLISAAAASLVFREIVQATDTLTNLQSQLRLVTEDQEELNLVFADTRQLAQDTRQDLGSTIKLYARLARSTEELELAHGDLLTITRAINQSYIVSGASAQEAAASTLQLSQGIASGTLRGEELNSVLENSPRLARAIADGLGVTIGELRALGAEGQLTGQQITQALLKTADDIDREFQQMPRTVGQALQQLRNDFVTTFGETDTSGLVDAIDDLRELVNDPVFRENMVSLGTAIANSIGVAAEALNEFVELGRQAGEAAARIAGNADDIQDLETSIRRLESLRGASGLSRSGVFTLLDGSVEFHLSEEEIDAELQAHRERLNELLIERGFAPRGSEGETEPVKTSTTVENEIELGAGGGDGDRSAIQKRIAALEEQAALLGKSRAEAELYKLAQEGATEAELAAARAALDRVAAYETAQEALQQTAKDTQALADIENQLLSLQGRGAEARGRELERQYAGLLQRLEQRSDEAGIEMVKRLINVEKAQAQLEQLQAEVDRIFSEQSRREQSIRAQREAGVMSEFTAREHLLELHRATAAEIEALIPKMRALAEATGDPAAIERIKQLRAEIDNLRVVTDEYGSTARDAFESGIADGLQALATGAQSVEEVVRGVVGSIAQSLAQLAAQKVAAAAAAKLFGGGDQGEQLSKGAKDLGVASVALAGAGGLVNQSAENMKQAAAALAAAAVASSASGGGFAEGGYTGSGTKYQVAGVVHAGEYVQPARVLREPGALGFMESFRREGMRALERFRGYAEGGLVSPANINIESPATTIAASVGPTEVRQRLLPVLDKDIIAEALQGPEGEELVLVHVTRNPGAFRQALGVS